MQAFIIKSKRVSNKLKKNRIVDTLLNSLGGGGCETILKGVKLNSCKKKPQLELLASPYAGVHYSKKNCFQQAEEKQNSGSPFEFIGEVVKPF